jgi:hypothetical protein
MSGIRPDEARSGPNQVPARGGGTNKPLPRAFSKREARSRIEERSRIEAPGIAEASE